MQVLSTTKIGATAWIKVALIDDEIVILRGDDASTDDPEAVYSELLHA